MRSYFDAEVNNIYEDDMAQKRYEAVNEKFRKEIESQLERVEEEILRQRSPMRIAVKDLTKSLRHPGGRRPGVSFAIAEGELFTLLGPSGCGKTTLLRLIAGFYAPDDGEVRFDDRNVNEVPPHERGIGMVFQNYALWPHMTVVRQRGLRPEAARHRPRRDRRRACESVLEKVKLGGLGDRYPGQLSGGQQQRVALARALVLNPKILLLDEPLSNLDAKIRVQVRAEIRKLQQELGITTVYVTHDQEEALTLSDRIAVFNQGKRNAGRPAARPVRAAGQPLRGRLHRRQQPDRRHGA